MANLVGIGERVFHRRLRISVWERDPDKPKTFSDPQPHRWVQVEVNATLEIDVDYVITELAKKAYTNKSWRTGMMGGRIRVDVLPCDPERKRR